MASNRIVLVVDFQSQSATNSINTLNQSIGQIGTSSQQATAQASQGIKGFTLAIDQASRSVSTLVASLTGLGLAAIGREWAMLGDTIQKAQFALTRAFGAEATAMISGQMRSLAHEAGLYTTALEQNAQTLGAVFRVPAEQIPGLMNVLVNFTRSLGGGQEELNNMVTLFGTMLAKEFITARELYNKFTAAGIPALQIMEKAFGKTRLELAKILKEQEVDIKTSANNILLAMQASSTGAAAAYVKAVTSAQLAQALDQLRELGLRAFVALRPAIDKVIEGLTMLVAVIVKLTEAYEKADEPTKNFIKNMAILAGILLVLPTAISAITAAWGALVAIFTAVSTVIGGLVTVFKALVVVWEVVEAATVAWAAILAAPVEIVGLLVAAILTVIAVFTKFTLFDGALKLIGDAWKYIKDQVSGAAEAIKKSYDAIKQFLGMGAGTGIGENIEEHRKALEESQASLFQAQEKNLKAGLEGIAALDFAYQEHLIKAKGYLDAEANYRLELAIEVDTEIKKREEEARKTHEKNAQELLRLNRQVAIAAAEVVPDSTFVGQARLASIKAQAHREELEQDRQNQIQKINEQLELDKKGAIAEGAVAKQNAYEINRNVQRLNETATQARLDANTKANDAIAEHDLQALRDLNKLKLEQEQQYRDMRLADELDMIQKTSQLEIAYTRAVDAQTLTAKVQQIQDIEDLQEQQIALTRHAQLTAAQEAFDAYKDAHADFAAGIKEEEQKLARAQVQIERDANVQIQMDRLDAWRTTNETIIEEQKKVYEGMKSTVEKIFDAITGKGKSVWEAISNAAKTAIIGTVKEQVSSQIAAGLTQSVTGKAVTFPGGMRRFFGNAPQFQGAGPRPAMQPVTASVGSEFTPLVVAGTDLSTAAGLLVNAASALTASAGAIVSTAGAGGGVVGGVNAGAVQNAVQTVQDAQTKGTLGAAALSTAAISSASNAGGVPAIPNVPGAGGSSGFIPGMPPITGVYQPDPGLLARATGGGNYNATPSGVPQAAAGSPLQQSLLNLKGNFGIGAPIIAKTETVDANGNIISAGTAIPWASATASQRLGAVLSSKGVGALAATVGLPIALQGLQKKGVLGGMMAVGGGALTGFGLARMFGQNPVAGAMAGGGLGLMGAGWNTGGALGLGMDVAGGAVAGAGIGAMIGATMGPLGLAAGAVIGAAVGAGAGAVEGVVRLFVKTEDEKIRAGIKQTYGVDISNQSIRKQIADIINQKYGGNVSIGILSQDVQDIVRLYAISTGQAAGLPRPMYSASFAQSGAGGLQMQPVYSGGQLVNNPYVGTTTTQLSNALFANPSVYVQLNPQQASNLLTGQVVKVINNNPGTVAAANTSAARSGTNRTAQASALMEPLTVTR